MDLKRNVAPDELQTITQMSPNQVWASEESAALVS